MHMSSRKRRNLPSNEEEIDWDKVLDNPEAPRPEVDKETLWVQLERMRQAQQALPKWHYFKMLVLLLDMVFFVGLGGFFWTHLGETASIGYLLVIVLLQLMVLGDSFVTVYKLSRKARGSK